MRQFQTRLISLAALTLAGLLPLSAHAASTWTASNCTSNCAETGDAAPNVSYSAYSAAINTVNNVNGGTYSSTGAFYQSSLSYYSGNGFGVSANSTTDTGTPQHAVDNYGFQDMILLKFDDLVNLTQVKIGYWADDADITVLAYTGPTAGVNVANTIVGKTAGSLLSTSGWTLVNSYADLQTTGSVANISTSINSSWWIVTAYNSQLGGAPTGKDGTTTGLTRGLGTSTSNTGYDFIKLYSVTGNKASGGTSSGGNVPEPASLALASIALLGVIGVRRQRKQSQR